VARRRQLVEMVVLSLPKDGEDRLHQAPPGRSPASVATSSTRSDCRARAQLADEITANPDWQMTYRAC